MWACLPVMDNHISHIYFIENILQSPVAFEMNAQQQIEAMLNAEEQELELLAAYHSHPQGPQTPSITDMVKAYYPDLVQIIVSLHDRSHPTVRAFTIINEGCNRNPAGSEMINRSLSGLSNAISEQ